jgi:hypothetical protein
MGVCGAAGALGGWSYQRSRVALRASRSRGALFRRVCSSAAHHVDAWVAAAEAGWSEAGTPARSCQRHAPQLATEPNTTGAFCFPV